MDFLKDLTYYTSIILPFFFIKGFSKNGKAFKIFTVYLIVIGLIQLSMRTYKFFEIGDNNLFFFIYYFVFQFVLLSFFYKQLLGFKWIIKLTVVILLFIGYQYVNEPSMYFRYNPIGSALTQIIVVGYSLLYFYKSLSKKGLFLFINFGVFFYFLSSILIYASGNLVFDTSIPVYMSKLLVDINAVLYLVFMILIFIEWYRNYRVKKAA